MFEGVSVREMGWLEGEGAENDFISKGGGDLKQSLGSKTKFGNQRPCKICI